MYVYYFRYPLYSAEAWFEQSKTIAAFAQQHTGEYRYIIIDGAGPMFLMQYGIYNRVNPDVISKAWKTYPRTKIGNIVFVEDYCNEKMPANYYHYPKDSVLIVSGDCYKSAVPIETIRDRSEDLHVIWRFIKM